MKDTNTTTPKPKFKKGDRVTTGFGGGEITGETQIRKETGTLMWRVFLDKKPDIATSRSLLFDEGLITPDPIPVLTTPPIDVLPECQWIGNRIIELSDAIQRYVKKGEKVPDEWMEELNRHMKTFNDRKP